MIGQGTGSGALAAAVEHRLANRCRCWRDARYACSCSSSCDWREEDAAACPVLAMCRCIAAFGCSECTYDGSKGTHVHSTHARKEGRRQAGKHAEQTLGAHGAGCRAQGAGRSGDKKRRRGPGKNWLAQGRGGSDSLTVGPCLSPSSPSSQSRPRAWHGRPCPWLIPHVLPHAPAHSVTARACPAAPSPSHPSHPIPSQPVPTQGTDRRWY